MNVFEWNFPTKLNYGKGNLARVGEFTKEMGKKAMVVTYGNPGAGSWIIEQVIASLYKENIAHVLYSKIEPNPRVTTIDEGITLFNESECDYLIAVGGGSVIDAGKFIAATAFCGGSCWDYVLLKNRKEKTYTGSYPIVAVPTVAASGSEANAGGVITNWATNEKSFCRSPYRFPKMAIIDPEVFATLPKHITTDSGVDVFSHLIEHYLSSPDNSMIADRLTEGLILSLMENLEKVLQNPLDLDARGELSVCSILGWSGLQSLGRVGSIPIHFIEHQLSGRFDISHGRGIAIVIPPYLEYFSDVHPDRWAKLARRVFGVTEKDDTKAAKMLVAKVREWFATMDMNITLSDVGIDASHIDILADDIIRMYATLDGDRVPGVRPMTREDIVNILRLAI